MLIVYSDAGRLIVASVSAAERLYTTQQRLVDPQPEDVEEPVYEYVSALEPYEDFAARMVATHVPSGAQYLVDPVLPDGVPPERWAIDWQTGAITIAAPTVAALKAYAADKRWAKEVGGTVVGGIPIPTDDRAKLMLLGASASMTDEQTAPYVVGSTAITLTGAQFKALYAGLVAHVQACFATQTTVLAAIDAGTITTTAQIDAAFI